MEPYEDGVRQAYRTYLGREPAPADLAYYAQQLQQNPNYDLASFIGNSVEAQEYNREQIRQNPANLRDVIENLPMRMPEGEGVVPLAYTLATGTELTLPEYETAGFTPDQLAAFETARGLQGAYEPYLQGGYQSTLQGIGSMGEALGGTRDLAQQIPSALQPGQGALAAAAEGVTGATQRGGDAARYAAEQIMAQSQAYSPQIQDIATRLTGTPNAPSFSAEDVGNRARNIAQSVGAPDLSDVGARARAAVQSTGGSELGDIAERARAAAQSGGGSGIGNIAERARAATQVQIPTITSTPAGGVSGSFGGGADYRPAFNVQDYVGADQAPNVINREGILSVASDTSSAARSIGDPLAQSLSGSTQGARALVSQGTVDANTAAERARLSTAEAQQALQEAAGFGRDVATSGISSLRGSTAMYTPDMLSPFMNTYEDAAVQQALRDIAREGDIREQQLQAQAVQAGAFGGSRQAVAEQELARNVLEQQGRTAAQMRSAGFESAAARSQDAFERAQQRAQSAAQIGSQVSGTAAGTMLSAAQTGGELALEAERLAQQGALSGAQLGLSGEQLAAANAQALAQTGLGIEQLVAQTGLSAQELSNRLALQQEQLGIEQGRLGIEEGRLNLSAEELAARTALEQGRLGLSAEELAARTALEQGRLGVEQGRLGLSAEELAGRLALEQGRLGVEQGRLGLSAEELAARTALEQGRLGLSQQELEQRGLTSAATIAQNQARLGMEGAQAAGSIGMQGAQMEATGAAQAGNLGLQGAQLGLSGIQAGLGAQQQAAGLGQGIAGLGAQQLGFGQTAQALGQQDVSMMGQIGQQQQAQTQAELDAQRMNAYQQALMPYQQLAFASDIAIGAPTGITSIMSQPGPSPLSQITGLATAGLGLYNAYAGAGQ